MRARVRILACLRSCVCDHGACFGTCPAVWGASCHMQLPGAGVTISAGDWVYADKDGVLVSRDALA